MNEEYVEIKGYEGLYWINNDLNNLEWCTQDYNFHYGTRGTRSGQTQRKTSPKRKPIIQYSLDMEFIAEFPSVAEAARQLNFCHSTISQCCKGNYKQAYGYIWKYKNI